MLALAALLTPARAADDPSRTVGPQRDGSIVVSTNQTLTPAGTLIDLGTPVRAKAIALDPDGASRTGAVLLMGSPQPVIIFDTVTGRIVQRFIPNAVHDATFTSDKAGSFTGITYAADGTKLFFSQDDNHVAIANVDPATGRLSDGESVELPPPPADGRTYFNAKAINPGGIALSDDGRRAYVVLNAANTVGVIDLSVHPAKLVAQIPVGNAPNSIVVRGNRAYVTNEGGRPAAGGDFTNLSDGTPIVVDRTDAFTTTGTVSVVDLVANTTVKTIAVGLHPAGLTVSRSRLFVANAYGDSLSIIDLSTDTVARTIDLRVPVDGGVFGSGPNSVAIVDGDQADVTLGEANAIAVIDLHGRDSDPVIGYIPTGYFPTSIVYDAAHHQLVVADDKGLGSQGAIGTSQGVSGLMTHLDTGTVNLIPLPNAAALARYTQQTIADDHWDLTTNIQVGPEYVDRNAKPAAVPKHIGEPSLIKHVLLIIKENRTYDQMLGDVSWANGDPSLAVFASAVPNQHALLKRFPVLDNVYAPSRQSADGHPWIGMSGSFYSNEILSPDWIRSYPGGETNDALTNTPKGFLWTSAEAARRTARLFGEWSYDTKVAKKPDGSDYTWTEFYQTAMCKEHKAPASACVVPDDALHVTSTIPSAQAIMDPRYAPFNLTIPDQYRVDQWLPTFEKMVATNQVPNLMILWLPDDHTAGMSKGLPAPINYQADNDLALGRIVDAVSHSAVWPQSAIFVEEDDSQSGVDHVDGHRQPVFVISPYTVAPQAPGQGKAIHTTYTAENINRTIKNILGMQPLTQFDLVASPMFDVFQNVPNLAPYDVVPATIPLDRGPNLPATTATAYSPMQRAWLDATATVMRGKYAVADAVDPNFLNHAIWYASTGWKRPYPGEKSVALPQTFVKAALRYHDEDDDR
jgi:hypothetical protein